MPVTQVTFDSDPNHRPLRLPYARLVTIQTEAAMVSMEAAMATSNFKDDRNILEVLKSELKFLEKGGYGQSPREPHRASLIFEDSPSCMNYDAQEHREPCEHCVLMQFVPREGREEKIPCRHIPLNDKGETLDQLYRYAEFYEVEDAMREWLRATIAKLEADASRK